jgi:signal peptidase
MSADDGPRPPEDGPLPTDDGSTDNDGVRDGTQTATRGAQNAGDGLLHRIRTATDGPLLVVRETALSVGAVVVVGLLLFAISGVWPPMVAVESGSMEPHMHRGDLVFITDTGRFAPDAAHEGTGVVSRDVARETGYWKFGAHGSVIVYDNPGNGGPPVIHRAQFWVEKGENWYDEANPNYVSANNCAEMRNCPAPNAGFVTKGDANRQYDQVNGISEPVKPEWVVGTARVRIPYLGWVRLGVSGVVLDTTFGTGDGTLDVTPPVAEAAATRPAPPGKPTPTPRVAGLAGS